MKHMATEKVIVELIRVKIFLLSTFCLFSLFFCIHSVLGEEVTKEKEAIPYKNWKDYTKEEKDILKSRWTEDPDYEGSRRGRENVSPAGKHH